MRRTGRDLCVGAMRTRGIERPELMRPICAERCGALGRYLVWRGVVAVSGGRCDARAGAFRRACGRRFRERLAAADRVP